MPGRQSGLIEYLEPSRGGELVQRPVDCLRRDIELDTPMILRPRGLCADRQANAKQQRAARPHVPAPRETRRIRGQTLFLTVTGVPA